MKPQKIVYMDDDPNKGIKYDWKKIRREYAKLRIPKIFFNPLKPDLEICGYYWALSDRSRGKTTQSLLLCMTMHEMYGTIGHYVRTDRDTIAPKMLKNLFDTITEYHYIEKITEGLYNSVYYYSNRWYYCFRDEEGNITDKAPSHFLYCVSLDDSDRLKSSYNCPRGDIIIFDEFIQLSGYGYSDFIRFSDLVSTIFRKRQSTFIYMLSNTIDITSPWLDEFCIRESVEMMGSGEARYIETSEGTKIFCEIMAPDETPQRSFINKRFFGFPNPKLAAITGKGVWATDHYPHIPPYKDDEPEVIFNRLFLYQAGKYVKLQVVETQLGLCVYVMPSTRTYKDSIILTHGDITDTRQFYGFGSKTYKLFDIVWRLYKANRFYYATNSEGALVKAYIKAVQDKQRIRMI